MPALSTRRARRTGRCAVGGEVSNKPSTNFDRAVDLQRAGKLDQAAELYREFLRQHPTHFEAAHNLGAILLQTGNFNAAERQLRRALQINPHSPEALNNLGLALRYLERLEEAVAAFDRAISLRPNYAQAFCNRGNALRLLKRPEQALESYDRALALNSSFADAFYNRGGVLEELQLWDDAVASYENAVALQPSFPQALNNLGNALFNLGQYEEALDKLNRALALSPRNADTLTNRGNLLREVHAFDAALSDHNAAIAINPACADCFNNRASVYRDLARFDEAIADYRHAMSLVPDHVEARANLALTQLLLGDWERGFDGYELRFRKRKNSHCMPDNPAPKWAGEALAGKRVLLFAEQGYGDAIQFIRFVPLLLARGARFTVQCQKRLHRLLSTVAPGVEFVERARPEDKFDFQIALMSLPYVLAVRPQNAPANIPYLHSDAGRSEIWRARLGERGFKVGLAWQGNPVGSIDNGRSIALQQFQPLTAIEGVRIISLQKNFGSEQLQALPAGMLVETPGFAFDDGEDAFLDTAAIMANLDLVITSDTSIAHLAGALGKPVWIALQFVPDWRWLLGRADSPWYPTAQLFRQTKMGDWDGVVREIAEALTSLARHADREHRLRSAV